MRDRNPGLERHLTTTAAKAAGLSTDAGLGAFADHRAHPCPVRDEGRGWPRDITEEQADARNYCVWGIEQCTTVSSPATPTPSPHTTG